MRFDKDGAYMITGRIAYIGSYTFNEEGTKYEQIELLTTEGELVKVKMVDTDAETRRVVGVGMEVTLYISAIVNKGAVTSCDVWAARDEKTGRIFVNSSLGEARLTTKIL